MGISRVPAGRPRTRSLIWETNLIEGGLYRSMVQERFRARSRPSGRRANKKGPGGSPAARYYPGKEVGQAYQSALKVVTRLRGAIKLMPSR